MIKALSMSNALRQAAQFVLGVPTDGLSAVLSRMLDLAQATPLAFVAVTGPSAGEAMAMLWRRGYHRVEAARRATCRAADEQSDILLVLGCDTVADIRAVAVSTYTMLRPGGALVVDCGALLDASQREHVSASLQDMGLVLEPCSHLAAEIMARRPWG